MSYDTAVIGGQVVFPGQGTFRVNIAVRDGKVAAVLPPDEPVAARQVINAQGRWVVPGVVESHTHLCTGNGYEDLSTETFAAVRSGVTSIFFFLRHPEPYDATFQRSKAEGEARSPIDFGMHAVLLTEEHLQSVPKYITEYGITSFKFYMTYRGADAQMVDFDGKLKRFEGIDDGYFYACMREISRRPSALLMVHAENIELIQREAARLQAEGRDDMAAYQESRPPVAEVEAVQRAARFAEATGCRVIILHVTTQAALGTIQRSRQAGAQLYAEVCHPYLAFYDDGNLGKEHKVRPPFRTLEDREALWEGVRLGHVDTIASDHVPRKLAGKLGSVWTQASGVAGTPTLLPFLIEEGFHRRGIPLHRVIETVTSAPARLYSVYPRKGTLQVGSDADLAVLDLETPRTVRAAELGSFADYSLYEGRSLRGWPTHVMVRGRLIVENGTVDEGAAGWGKYLRRESAGPA